MKAVKQERSRRTFQRHLRHFDHNLLIAKVSGYGFGKQSMNFVYSHLTKGKQRTKVNSVVSSWGMLFSSVPQGSVLEPLLFNIYVGDMFFKTPANI